MFKTQGIIKHLISSKIARLWVSCVIVIAFVLLIFFTPYPDPYPNGHRSINDSFWIIGSAGVFLLVIIYLLRRLFLSSKEKRPLYIAYSLGLLVLSSISVVIPRQHVGDLVELRSTSNDLVDLLNNGEELTLKKLNEIPKEDPRYQKYEAQLQHIRSVKEEQIKKTHAINNKGGR